ncbi:MAG: hypothetical protein HOC71_07995 [Candidatus Latescibacteria bacterium]|jgi:uncharacterized phosphosugar-binding protein|nr:hypothetical protein [Candidatus Latescibacterota bacterium]
MKRRDAVRLIPLSIASIAGMSQKVFAGEKLLKKPGARHSEPLAIQYTKKVRKRLAWIRENQTENLMEASYAIARTVQNGGQCYQSGWDAGHTEADSWPGRNGEPEIFSTRLDIKKARKGDLILAASQMRYNEDIRKKQIFLVACPSPWSGDAKYSELLSDDVRELTLKEYADIWIENQATTLGGIMYVPGMPAPIGPVSGVAGKTTIWMMLADACRILARRGISLTIKGDEPKVTGDNVDWRSFSGWESLNDPLMDNYFHEVIRQIDLIGAELGTIRKIAKMAVDSVLSGGKIYGYSLHNSIAGEASTRRSGLSMTQGIYGSTLDTEEKRRNFKGTSKDCVIMGITKPDDETDLMFLDLFKKRGMKTASFGPMTRSIKVPEGRTVPKETDLHAGRMCDTYGLFALPGLDQRICPTSGVLLDQLFWATMMEVVEQYIERTGGDVPGVFFSAALKGGREHMYRMLELYRER